MSGNKENILVSKVCYQTTKTQILADINFSAKKGEILGLLGINGAGKSTILKLCAGVLHPSYGEIIHDFEGHNYIGYLPENPPLIFEYSVFEYLKHICKLQKINKSIIKQSIDRVVNILELEKVLHKNIKQLSKGNQQRVGIAQAIIHKPKLLILDEPTSGLDPRQISHFRDLLISLKDECCIIFSTHIMQEVSQLCNRVIIISNGKIVSKIDLEIEKNETLTSFEFVEEVDISLFENNTNFISIKDNIFKFNFEDNQQKQYLISFCLNNNLNIKTITESDKSLEDKFLNIIGHN